MKTKILLTAVLFASLSIGVLQRAKAQPQEKTYYEIDIMGQVTHSEYGSPIINHSVYIVSDSLESSVMEYFKEVITDEDGFYHDTIVTTLTHGAMEIYTYDYYGEKQTDTIYFRFLDATNRNIFINNFSIFIPFQIPSLQARFLFVKTTTENKLMYTFTDQTKNENIQSWEWDFGDGTTSSLQNPVHIFPKAGVYKVKLTVKAWIDDHIEINSLSQYVYIASRNYYHLGGHCFADHQFPIDEGVAYLFRKDPSNHFTPIDTANFDTLGYYYFYQIPEGNYIIKSQPSRNSEYYGLLIPTYYGDKINWEEATVINHDHTDWEYDTHLFEALGINTGNGSISGSVVKGVSVMAARNITPEDVNIILYDILGNPLTCTYSDAEGYFSLSELPIESYFLGAEITGISQQKTKIDLTEDKPEYNDIIIDLQTGDVMLDVTENMTGSNIIGTVYPNPASGTVNLIVKGGRSENAIVEIVNLQGQVLFSKPINLAGGNSNRRRLDISGLENGIYFIRVKTDKQVGQQRIVVSG